MPAKPCESEKLGAEPCAESADWFGFKFSDSYVHFVCDGHKSLLQVGIEAANTGPYWRQLSTRTWYFVRRVGGDEQILGEIQHTAEGQYRFSDKPDELHDSLLAAQDAVEAYVGGGELSSD